MSNRTVGVGALEVEDAVEYLERWYHVPLIGLAMAFMLWVRLLNYEEFRRDDGVAFAAVDSWYHWRSTEWTVRNYPRTMPYEIYTGFPSGKYVGQFGTLFDQIVATVAIVVGLGDPSASTVQAAALITVPALAALVAIPVYLLAAKLGGRLAGVIAVAILAIGPSAFLSRSTTGQFQHHVAEVLFMALALLAMVVALRVAEREKPIWELVEAREWDELKTPGTYAALAGGALCLYLWTWPPAVMFLGILGAFFAVHLAIDFLRGVSPDHVAFVGAISMAIPVLFLLVMLEEWSTSVTAMGVIQPVVALLVAVGCLFMAWLAREWDARGIERSYYPVAVAGIGVVGLGALAVLLPDVYSTIVGNVTSRILPIGPSETGLTIQEVKPPEDFVERATQEFGMGLYLMLGGLGLIAARPFLGKRYRAEHTLVIVWSLFLISMAMTQVRFWYYFILPVAIGSGYAVGQVIRWLDIELTDQVRDVETYQVLVVLLVVIVVFVPFAPQIATFTAVDYGEAAAPSTDSIVWEESNVWMQENTPEPGNLYGAGKEAELDYYGTYTYPDGGDFEYPEGAYGVMSWWDYGHLITTQANRIPHANPFQQNARSASAYLLAPDEATAEGALDLIAGGGNPRLDAAGNLTDEPPAEVTGGEEMQYVMIDHLMAGGKFGAITEWTGPSSAHYFDNQQPYTYNEQEVNIPAVNENFYDTQLASLYLQDANGMEHYRLVHETDDYAFVGGWVHRDGTVARLASYHHTDVRGIDGSTWENIANVSRTVDGQRNAGMVDGALGLYEGHVVSSVKTFERVEGATIEGSADAVGANATATVGVELETATGRTFTYTQDVAVDENGDFALTVPYATEEEVGPEDGYTNSSVTALGDYQVYVAGDDGAYTGNASVGELAVYEGETVAVDLEPVEPDEGDGEGGEGGAGEGEGDDGTDGGDGADDGSGDDGSGDGGTDDTQNDVGATAVDAEAADDGDTDAEGADDGDTDAEGADAEDA